MSIFSHNRYLLRKQAIALTGRFRIYDMQGNMLMFSQQKAFKLKEDIRVYTDEQRTNEVLLIQARQIIDFSAAYDVVDSTTAQKVGALRRKGMKSIIQDEWEILDVVDQPIAIMKEDSLFLALFRRLLSGLVPQNYDVLIGGQRVADLKQNFNPFTYRLTLDFSMDSMNQLDRRLGIAAGILLGAIEGRQS
jgi:hypothetical protein